MLAMQAQPLKLDESSLRPHEVHGIAVSTKHRFGERYNAKFLRNLDVELDTSDSDGLVYDEIDAPLHLTSFAPFSGDHITASMARWQLDQEDEIINEIVGDDSVDDGIILGDMSTCVVSCGRVWAI